MTPEEYARDIRHMIADVVNEVGTYTAPLDSEIDRSVIRAIKESIRAEQVVILNFVKDRNNGRVAMGKFIRDRMYQK